MLAVMEMQMTDAETIADLQKQLANVEADLRGAERAFEEMTAQRDQARAQLAEELKKQPPSASWMNFAKEGFVYLANNKAAMVAVLAFAGVVYHHIFPQSPPLDQAKIQAVVDDAVKSRPPVLEKHTETIREVLPPAVKSNVPGEGEGGKGK